MNFPLPPIPLPPTPPFGRRINYWNCIKFCPYCGSSIVRYGFLWRKLKCLQPSCKYNQCSYTGNWELIFDASLRQCSQNIYKCPECNATGISKEGHLKKEINGY